jgi:5-methylcytosine-specific restriction endonuclease McrA
MTELNDWLEVRERYLTRMMTEDGLVCEYCGRTGLLLTGDNHRTVATVDHVHPVSKGGPKFDENNFKVACFKCNQKKADKV